MSIRPHAARGAVLASLLIVAACGGAASTPAGPAALRLGAVFPQTGPQASLAAEEALGVRIALDMQNAEGGVGGRRLELDTRDLSAIDQSTSVVDSLHRDGVPVVFGAYSSDISVPASAAADRDGMVYWEAGAVADRLTGRGLPLVFRVGASGANLGGNSGRFAVEQLAPRLHRAPSQLRMSLVVADDGYAHSVADAAVAVARSAGMTIASETLYNAYRWDFTRAIADVRAARPDILVLASHIPDGIDFRRAFLRAGLHVDAFIGSTMAQCMDDFGEALGAQAVGVFASDRPGDGYSPAALPAATRAVYDRFAAAWKARHGGTPSEEGLSGFSAAWALVHDVLPAAAAAGHLDAHGIAAAARAADLPEGSLADGAGLRFATTPDRLGQNLRAAAVVWQWQAVDHSVVVWPPEYATGTVSMAATQA